MTVVEHKSTQSSGVETVLMGPAAMSGLSNIGDTPIKLREQPSTRHRSLKTGFLAPRLQRHLPECHICADGGDIAIRLFAWWSHLYIRKLSSSNVTLSRAVQSLTKDNDVLSQKNAALNQQLGQVIASQQNPRHVEVSIRSLSKWVNDLVMNGEVKPTERVQLAMAALSTPVTRGIPSTTEQSALLPLTPVRTGIRTTAPTLRWRPSSRSNSIFSRARIPGDRK